MRKNIVFVAILITILATIWLAGCASTTNGKGEIVVEKTPPVQEIVKDSLVPNLSQEEKQSLVDMWSCSSVRHEITTPYENTNHQYDPSKIQMSCATSQDKKEIRIKVICFKPCSHLDFAIVSLRVDPPIQNYQGTGLPMAPFKLVYDKDSQEEANDIIRFKDNQKVVELSAEIQSDGLEHKITPYFLCSYTNSLVKSDEFYGDSIEVK